LNRTKERLGMMERAHDLLMAGLGGEVDYKELSGWLLDYSAEQFCDGVKMPIALKEGAELVVYRINDDCKVELRDPAGNVYMIRVPPFYLEEEETEDA
jgi:hypothetical protein